MKFVPDTNVLMSAAIGSGLCVEIINEGIALQQVYLSEYILEELQRVLPRKTRYTADDARRIANYYRLPGIVGIVQPVEVPEADCTDGKDLPVLGTAVAAEAQYLVTGDGHLLELKKYRGILIVTPRVFHEATHNNC